MFQDTAKRIAAPILVALATVFAPLPVQASRIGITIETVAADPSPYAPIPYQSALSELRRESGALEIEISRRLREILPLPTEFDAAVIVTAGDPDLPTPSGHAVFVRIEDFPGDGDSPLDAERFVSAVTHVLFRIGFDGAGGASPRPRDSGSTWTSLAATFGPELVGEVWRRADEKHWDGSQMASRFEAWVPPDEWDLVGVDRFVHHLAGIARVGCATYAEVPLRDGDPHPGRRAEIDVWMETIERDFDVLAALAAAVHRGASAATIDAIAEAGFEKNGPLYRVGFRMAERIDRNTGRRALQSAIAGGPLEFIDAYLATHPDGPGHVDADTERVLRRLIREVRAVGAFDPWG